VTRVRGSNIGHARVYAEREGGPGSWQRVLDELTPPDRQIIEGAINVGWYELTLQHRLFQALDGVLASKERPGIEGFAENVAHRDLTLVHRLFLRLANPAYVLEKSGEYWGRFYDAGHWTVTRHPNRIARGELTGIVDPDPIFCRFVVAYITSMFKLVGVPDAKVNHMRCVCRGGPSCVFEGVAPAGVEL
jgi:hypothetical protein